MVIHRQAVIRAINRPNTLTEKLSTVVAQVGKFRLMTAVCVTETSVNFFNPNFDPKL